MTLLGRLKVLCDEKGETFASLERKLNFGNATIRKWDEATPSGDRLAKVADYFGVTVDYLLGREDTANDMTLPRLRLLARKAHDLPDSEREELLNDLDRTIDTYLRLTKNKKEDK